jgi:hypothetical protein
MRRLAHVLVMCGALANPASAEEDDAALAQKLANPIANLVSVPINYNWDHDIGPVEGGHSTYMKFEPVIPFRLDSDWTLIARTVMKVIDQTNVEPGSGSQFGITDTTESFYFTPNTAGPAGFIWGVGPGVSIPATNSEIDSEHWGLGPTAAVVIQPGRWTIGVLAEQIWSVGGGPDAPLNELYLQPFITYTTKDAWSISLESESYYFWLDNDWSIPLHFELTKLIRIGDQPISIGPILRYWAASTDSDAHNWGVRFAATLLFPDR